MHLISYGGDNGLYPTSLSGATGAMGKPASCHARIPPSSTAAPVNPCSLALAA